MRFLPEVIDVIEAGSVSRKDIKGAKAPRRAVGLLSAIATVLVFDPSYFFAALLLGPLRDNEITLWLLDPRRPAHSANIRVHPRPNRTILKLCNVRNV